MATDERYEAVLPRLDRAKEHFRDLNEEVIQFFKPVAFGKAAPYEIKNERDPATRELIYFVARVSEIPKRVPILAGDIIHNCRSALDHLAYQLSLVGNPNAAIGRQTGFPIFDDAATYNAGRSAKVRGMRQDAVDRIDSIRPYFGGNNQLWQLHRLNNIDKHRLLLTVASQYQARTINGRDRELLAGIFAASHPDEPAVDLSSVGWIDVGRTRRRTPLREGDRLYVAPPDSEVNENMRFQIDLAFAEPNIADESMIATLSQLMNAVEDVIVAMAPCLT